MEKAEALEVTRLKVQGLQCNPPVTVAVAEGWARAYFEILDRTDSGLKVYDDKVLSTPQTLYPKLVH